jgi:O-antigen/teichoic acid export membrane protein
MIQFRSQASQRYLVNTTWIVAEKVVRMAVALFVAVYVARYLGPHGFGVLSFAMSFVGLFAVFATLGVDEILVRNLVQEPDSFERLLGTAFTLRLVGAFALFALVTLAVQFTSSDKTTKALALIIAGGTLFQSFNIIDFYFQSRVLARFTSFAQICTLFIGSAAKLSLIAAKASLIWFAWVTVFENATLALLLVLMYRRQRLNVYAWRFDIRLSLALLRDAWPLMLAGAAITVYMRIDQVMIKEMLDSEAVGNYAAAVRFSEACYFIPVALCSSLFPAIIHARSMGKEEYHDRLQKLCDLMIWLAVAIALPTTFLADWIISFLLGAPYHSTAGVLKIHVWAGVFVYLGVASGKWFLAENLQRYAFYRTLAGAIVNVFLNLILIPSMGIKGAALATVLSYFAAAYLSMAFFKPTKELFRLATRSFNPIAATKRIFYAWNRQQYPQRSSA